LALQQKETLAAKTQRLEKLKVDEIRLTTILVSAAAKSKAKAKLDAAKLQAAKKANYDAALAKRQTQLAAQAKQKEQARQATLAGKPIPKVAEVQIDPAPVLVTEDDAPTLGKLKWPSSGVIFGHFGTKRPSGSTWKGIYLTQKSGESVLAAMAGRVIYAANLSGYGNTLIIDHGQGYMSVYAGLLAFNANVGDVVSTGSPIAKSGQMADLPSGLYFELRATGRAINPMPWF
jgi:septal ring factor EnvC (AmiA/AmiB activator)